MTKDELITALDGVPGRCEVFIKVLENELADVTLVKLERTGLILKPFRVVLGTQMRLDLVEEAAP